MKVSKLLSARDAVAMVIVGATTGVAVACIFIAAQFSADAGDILGFVGGALGAGLAVIGALWTDRRKSAEMRDEVRNMLAQSLVQLAAAAGQFSRVPDFGVVGMLLTIRQAIHTFESIKTSVRIDDAVAYLSMSSIIYWVRVYDEQAEDLYGTINAGEISAANARAQFGPKMEVLTQAIRNTLTSHPYWPSDSLTTLDNLLAAAMPWDSLAANVAK